MKTKEDQYELLFEVKQKYGITKLGLMVNESWNQDPKRTLFTLSRYKFVARMFEGLETVLEVGCADAFATRIVQQHVGRVTATDFDPVFIRDARERLCKYWDMTLFEHDILRSPVRGGFDAAFCLDVLEHIDPLREEIFIRNLVDSIKDSGSLIIGIPSLESQPYASPQSKAGHINCKSGHALRALLLRFFSNVFLFSMNDEVVHTGYSPMAHYLLVLCCGKLK